MRYVVLIRLDHPVVSRGLRAVYKPAKFFLSPELSHSLKATELLFLDKAPRDESSNELIHTHTHTIAIIHIQWNFMRRFFRLFNVFERIQSRPEHFWLSYKASWKTIIEGYDLGSRPKPSNGVHDQQQSDSTEYRKMFFVKAIKKLQKETLKRTSQNPFVIRTSTARWRSETSTEL